MIEEIEKFEKEQSNQSRRWVFTINNPLGTDYEDIDISKTNIPYKEDYYSKDIMNEFEESGYFIFKNIKVLIKEDDFTKSELIIRRPFFKSIDSAIDYFKSLEHFKYCIFSLEQGKEEETPHFQGFITFGIGKRFATIKKYLPFAHIEQARGSNAECRDYCKKSDTHVAGPFEIGEFVEQRARTDKSNFIQLIHSGITNSELAKLDSNLYLSTSQSKIEAIRADAHEIYRRICRNVVVTYIYGPPRVGKTSSIFKKYGLENVFTIDNYGDFQFNGYNYENVLLMDEFNSQVRPITKLNKLLEPFPLKLNIKGGYVYSAYEKIYIVSNSSLDRMYVNDKKENYMQYLAFISRIDNIIRFDKDGNTHYEKRTEWEDIPEDKIEFPGLTKRKSKVFTYDEYGNEIKTYDLHNSVPGLQEVKNIDLPFVDEDEQDFIDENGNLKF